MGSNSWHGLLFVTENTDYQGMGLFWGSFFHVWFMFDRCKNHLKYSCVKKRTHRHFHDFHLALYLCHYKTCFCSMHNQGAEHLLKSCYSKMFIKLNIIVVFLNNEQLDNIMTSNNTVSDTCWNDGYRLIRWGDRGRSGSLLVGSWGRWVCDGGYLWAAKWPFESPSKSHWPFQ